MSLPDAPSEGLTQSLYDELHRCAAAQMRREAAGHTLSATALTHEAWMRMAEQTRTAWQSRSHFLGVAALMMRRILINHAMAKQAAKREAALVSLTLTEAQQHSPACSHTGQARTVSPLTGGCEECLKLGDSWVHLRVCLTCGHVGCCDDSKNKHATAHFHGTGHPIIRSFEPNETWAYCYEDETML